MGVWAGCKSVVNQMHTCVPGRVRPPAPPPPPVWRPWRPGSRGQDAMGRPNDSAVRIPNLGRSMAWRRSTTLTVLHPAGHAAWPQSLMRPGQGDLALLLTDRLQRESEAHLEAAARRWWSSPVLCARGRRARWRKTPATTCARSGAVQLQCGRLASSGTALASRLPSGVALPHHGIW